MCDMRSFVIALMALLVVNYARGEVSVHQNGNEFKDAEESNDYRLPTTIIPQSYDIGLQLPLYDNVTTFKGTVKINATTTVTINEIILHCGNLTISTTAVLSNKTLLKITKTSYNDVTETLKLSLDKELLEGTNITIAIVYEGTLRNDMIGFYRSFYIDNKGYRKWLAATQLHATHARHVFPCFDEPSFKAIFTVRILRPANFTSLSNMPRMETSNLDKNLIWDVFGDTVVMSTYLVAFVVSEFSSLTDDSKKFSVWARPSVINQTAYALKIGPQALELFAKLFDEDYPLPKMDMVAIPDFSAGAMENWGLITYREPRLLYDENVSSARSQQDIASVIVHECLHSWFGNLVTPKWWSYLWLSEGFARYYEYYATAKLEPSWKMEQQFVVDHLQMIFGVDALDSSQPMSRDVSTQTEIGNTGNAITYSKGASIVRMMELTFGSDIFNSALREYLRKRKYSSATPDDLWESLQSKINLSDLRLNASIEAIMDTWTRQAGFPVLSLSMNKGVVNLRQDRFLLRNQKSMATNTTWWIPITWTTEKNPNFNSTQPKYWLGGKNGKLEINSGTDQWVIFNIQEAGFYRVNYDKNSWDRIIKVLHSESFENIPEVNRAAIVDDLLNLARAGLVDYDTALTGLSYIKRETNYIPFKAAFAGLHYLKKRFTDQENNGYFANFSLSLIDKIYDDLGFDDRADDDRLTILLRNELNNWACNFNHQQCIAKSLEYFSSWRNKVKSVPKNQRPTVYCAAIRYGSPEDWEFLWEQYLSSNFPSDQLVILTALGCSQNTTILKKYLHHAITPFEKGYIRRQDSTFVFRAVYESGTFGAETVLYFIANYHPTIAKYYGGYDTVATILSEASQYFSTQNLINIFETIIRAVDFKTIAKSLETSLNDTKYELQWFRKNEPDIIAWWNKYNKDEPMDNTTSYRLPTSIIPKSYVIKLTPFIEPGDFTFEGNVLITANVTETTDKIVLHVNEIVREGITITVQEKPVKLKSIVENKKYNFLTITLDAPLMVGTTIRIDISYRGELNSAMKGFYRSSYLDENRKTRWLAATHLEPVGARRMFPCFDEPALKATFTISVNRPVGYNAISNTPLKTSAPEINGRVYDTFEETPVMSTYLVALIISDFKSVDDGIYATWARPNAINQVKYALSVMRPLVKYFEKAVEHRYQLSKLDMVALPDFSSGAMENWGLLTYKESNMLYDENHTSLASKQAIANVISHEISHQWFGNQVSPRWWKYLWLNEGFARYFQYHGTAHVETKWGLESQFVVEQLHSAFGFDAGNSTHPMTHDVYSPAEISGIFDTISYAKAGSILRMVEKTFGTTLFYEALHVYLTARNRSDATPEHLFDAFQDRVNLSNIKLEASIKTIMDTWTTQAGYPVVHVDMADGIANLSQERFLLRNRDNADTNKTWWIPLTWASKSNPDFETTVPKYWLAKINDSIKLNNSDEWIIFNVQQSGYYRVNYDNSSWNRLIDALKSEDFDKIHEINRAALIDDLLNLGRAGHVDYGTVLSATQYLINETNYIPWRAAFNGLSYLKRQFEGKDIYELYKTHIWTILKPSFEKLGFNEIPAEPHYDKLLRRFVVDWACDFGVESCIKTSLQYFSQWKLNSTKLVPVDVRAGVYCTAIRHGSANDWEFLWKKYLSANVPGEKNVILSALGCSNSTEILREFLKTAITGNSEIRFQDSLNAFASVYSSGLFGAEYTLDFVEQHYMEMFDYYGDYKNIGNILSGLSSRFSTKNLVVKFQKFVERYESNLAEIKDSLQTYLTHALKELTWYDIYSQQIFEWLDKTYLSEDYRLPTTIHPTLYEIYLTPYLKEKNFTFDGEVRIEMQVLKNTSSIVLLANELTIKEILVYIDSVHSVNVSRYILNANTHKFTIHLETMLVAGTKVSANIKYSGILNDKMKGFYRSSYVNEKGETRWLASTQFEPVHARQAFPCFDEPAFKSKFIINIERPNDYQTLSNMPRSVLVPSSNPNRTWDTYEKSKTMSSYLVAFIVSDFEALKNKVGNFSIWGRPEAVKHSSYALDVGQKVLGFMETFTGIDYPIRKMDLVAVPDFSAGAMENWGLITFREYALFHHENVTSATYKKYLNTVVAHELVHMWFGNLVTCDWWDYVWLHEGFAEYLEWIAGDFTEPDWELLQQFVVYDLQVAMEADASPTIHPMNNQVVKPNDISNSFDKIAYGKSASVIRMMHHAFGPEIFQLALHTYLDRNQYGNAKPHDLWSAVEYHDNFTNSLGIMNVTVKTVMDSWANQSGFPVVNATWTSGLLTLTQQRFLLSKPKEPSENLDNKFWIPVTITTKSQSNFTNTRPSFWFGTRRSNTPLTLVDNEWYVLNIQEAGYYRVNYDQKSWNRLSAALLQENFDGIHEINRAQIIDDLLNLARTDYISYDTALSATKYLDKEENHLPWRAFFNGVEFLNQRFYGHQIGEEFATYILGLMNQIYEKTGFVDMKDESQLDQLNRQLILTWACKLAHSQCMEKAQQLFNDWRGDEEKWISPNARPAVYCTSIRSGIYEDWEFLWQQYEKTNFASEKVVILNALGCSRNTTTLNEYLKRAISLSDTAIRDQDVGSAFSSVYNAGRVGADAALDFLINNFKDVHKYYNNWNNVASLFSNIAGKLSTQEQIDKLEAFVDNTTLELAEILKSLRGSVDVAKGNLQWFNLHSPGIRAWLTKKDGDGNSGGGASLIGYSVCLVIITLYLTIIV